MSQKTSEYITSEKFIWDDLILKAKAANESTKKLWGKKKNVTTRLLAWPTEELHDKDGILVTDAIVMTLPKNVQITKALRDLIAKTRAYAVLVTGCNKQEVYTVLESHHGVRYWTSPIERHGDVFVLEATSEKIDIGGFDLLWKRNKGQS